MKDKKKKIKISEKDFKRLVKIHEQLLDQRKKYDDVWKRIAKFINPNMQNWDDAPDRDALQNPSDMVQVYDATAQTASNTLADGIQGYAFSRNQAWFKVAIEGKDDLTDEESGYVQDSIEAWQYNKLNKSNFYDEARNFVKLGADFGTAIMLREWDSKRGVPAYKVQHLKRCCIDENEAGEVDTLFRDYYVDAYHAAELFGEEALPDAMRDAYKASNLRLWKFTQAIFPLGKYGLDIPKKKGKDYYSVTWADIEKDKAIDGGYYSFKPFYVWRWSRNLDGDVWGVDSPGTIGIADIQHLNGMVGDYHRIVQQMGRPPMKATEGLKGRINRQPGGITWVRPGEDYGLAPVTGDIGGLMQDIGMIRQSINSIYKTELFLVLTQNIERQKTATEVSGIQGEKAALMSAFYGRLSVEFLEPLIEDLVSVGLELGEIDKPPESLFATGEFEEKEVYNEETGRKEIVRVEKIAANRTIKVDMVSPLALMQKRYLLLGASQQAYAEIFGFAQIRPEVLDNINFDQHVHNVFSAYGVDKREEYDQDEVDKVRQARAQQQAQMQQAQMQMQAMDVGSKAAANMGKAPPELQQQLLGAQGAAA